MKKILLDNKWYFILFFIWIVFALIIWSFIEKGDAIFAINQYHMPFWDVFFKYGTKLGEEHIYVVSLFVLLFVRYRHLLLIPILGLVVTLVSHGLKTFFSVARPITYFRTEGMADNLQFVEGVDLYTAMNSFPSGHTMSAFAIYTLLALLLPKKNWIALLCFILALIVGISRVYLVQHFWADITVGSLVGVMIGMLFYWIQTYFSTDINKWWNRSVLTKKIEQV